MNAGLCPFCRGPVERRAAVWVCPACRRAGVNCAFCGSAPLLSVAGVGRLCPRCGCSFGDFGEEAGADSPALLWV